MVELNEAYVTGLLADLETEVPRLQGELGQARARAAAVGAELSSLVTRLDGCKTTQAELQDRGRRGALDLNDKNSRIASLHQELAGLKRRSDDLKTEMDRVGEGAIQRKLRRDRAKLSVQIEDREVEVQKRRAEVDALRQQVHDAEVALTHERDKMRAIGKELDLLQGQLVDPYLYTRLFDRIAARGHCRFFFDRNGAAWAAELASAIGLVLELHSELRAGKYRLDKNSDIVGGRAMATAEALYGAVALDDRKRAIALFELATDPGLYFHQIFNVFRVWCLGLLLTERYTELKELMRTHRYALGLRGGYVQTCIGLVAGDAAAVSAGLKAIVEAEWEIWQDPSLVRGAGVINLGGLAFARLATARGIPVRLPGPTIPAELLRSARKPAPAPPTAPTRPLLQHGRR